MSEVVVSGLDDATFQRLQRRAEAHGWTVQEEVKYLLTRGLDALEYAEQAFQAMKESADRRSQPSFDVASQRAKIEQMLNEASARDAKALEEWDQLFADLNHLGKRS